MPTHPKTTRSARRSKPGKETPDISRPFVVLVGGSTFVSCRSDGRVARGQPVTEDWNPEFCGANSCVAFVIFGWPCALCPACAAIVGFLEGSETGGPSV